MRFHPAVSLAFGAGLGACGGSLLPERDTRGVGAVCERDAECAVGMRCLRALDRGICQPPPREGAVSAPPGTAGRFVGVGGPCETSGDCVAGLDCVPFEEGRRCEPATPEK